VKDIQCEVKKKQQQDVSGERLSTASPSSQQTPIFGMDLIESRVQKHLEGAHFVETDRQPFYVRE